MLSENNIHMSLVPTIFIEDDLDCMDGYLYTKTMAKNNSIGSLTDFAVRRFERFTVIDEVCIYVNGNSPTALGAVIAACQELRLCLILLYSRNEDDTWNKQELDFREVIEIFD